MWLVLPMQKGPGLYPSKDTRAVFEIYKYVSGISFVLCYKYAFVCCFGLSY